MVELRVLGTVSLENEAGEEVRSVLAHPKRVALLAYLAIASPRGFHRRDTLVGLLWPESSDDRARHSLNQALYMLRRALGSDVIRTRGSEEVELDRTGVRCDAVSFVDLLAEGKGAEALGLYRGDLLPGFHVSGCGGFERWLEGERRRLRDSAVRAAWRLVEVEEARGRHAEALRWARRARELAPYDEPAERRLVELLAGMGDYAGAIHAYETFAARLRQDLGTKPSPELRELVEGLRRAPDQPGEGGVEEGLTRTPSTGRRAAPPATVHVGGDPPRSDAPPVRATRRPSGVLLGAAVLTATVLGGAFLLNGRSAAPDPGPERILVSVFENETGDSALDVLGRMAADWIARDLARTGLVRVATAATAFRIDAVVRSRADALAPRSRLRATAEEFGDGTLVWGTYYLEQDSIVFQAHAVRAPGGEILRSVPTVMAPTDEPLKALEALSRSTSVALAPLLEDRLQRWTRYSSQSRSWEAYREFVAGLEAHTTGSGDALVRYRKAMELDSTWTLPALWALWRAPPAEFDAVLGRLSAQRPAMSPFDAALFDYHRAWGRQDGPQIYRAATRLVELAPDSEFLFKKAFAAVWVRRSDEAVELLQRADPDHGWLRDWRGYWILLADAHHRLGEHDDELAALRRARQRFPAEPGFVAREAQALVEIASVEEALRVYDELSVFSPDEVGAYHHFFMAGILRLQGHRRVAEGVSDRALARYEGLDIHELSGASVPTLALEWAKRGDFERAKAVLDAARERLSARGVEDHPVLVTSYGVVAALEGREEDAASYARRLTDEWSTRETPGWTNNYNRGNAYWGRAAIAAYLGEIDAAIRFVKLAAAHGKHPIIPVDLWYEPLWAHPEYRRLVTE